MALAVTALWVCIAMEAHTRHQADADARVCMERLHRLRQDTVPASTPQTSPSYFRAHHGRASAS